MKIKSGGGRRFACPPPKKKVGKTNRQMGQTLVFCRLSPGSRADSAAAKSEKSSTRQALQARPELKLGKKLLGSPKRQRPVYQAIEKDGAEPGRCRPDIPGCYRLSGQQERKQQEEGDTFRIRRAFHDSVTRTRTFNNTRNTFYRDLTSPAR